MPKMSLIFALLGESGRACVAVIRLHHRGQLLVAHRVHAAVGQHVDEDVAVLQQERVVARLVERFQPALDGHQICLDNAHLVTSASASGEEIDFRHMPAADLFGL